MTRILVGDALAKLRDLPDESVHCVVTSPPYWALREYHGDPGMIGGEPTLQEHIDRLVAVFREVRRVLRKDGTCWLNYGDAYAGGGRGAGSDGSKQRGNPGSLVPANRGWTVDHYKPKDLMLMSARVALALQADGWWVRQRIVWEKPNTMPDSAIDRPTSAFEDIYLLTRSPTYFFDDEAVREPTTGTAHPRRKDRRRPGSMMKGADPNDRRGTWLDKRTVAEQGKLGRKLRNVWSIHTARFHEKHYATFPPAVVEPCILSGTSAHGCCARCGAPWVRQMSKRGYDVSRPQTRRALELADQAGLTQEHVDAIVACGVTDAGKTRLMQRGTGRNTERHLRLASEAKEHLGGYYREFLLPKRTTVGWQPTCCDCWKPIATPRSDGKRRPDPTPRTGRKGLGRERNPNPPRSMTRGEQRAYARQLRESPHMDAIRKELGSALEHYVRTDTIGGRPLPPDVLEDFIGRGWLVHPVAPMCEHPCRGEPLVPATVLDPFAGAGTVGLVAEKLGRNAILIEISEKYAEMARQRIVGPGLEMYEVVVE